jgi:hypothetical protein
VESEPVKTQIISAAERAADSTGALTGTNPTDEAANELVANFRLKRMIGQSARGVTYIAEQLHPRQVIALKLVRAPLETPEARARFEAAVEPLRRLQHPGIAHVIEADTVNTTSGPRPYFAMELVRGISPSAHAKLRKLATRQRLELFVQICDAVQHAHARGVCHGDIKAENLLVADADGQPKVLDFGVATALGAGAAPNGVCEDVAALGRLASDLLAGCSVPADVARIIAKSGHRDPVRRYATAEDLAADVRRHLGQGGTHLGQRKILLVLILSLLLVTAIATYLLSRG